MIAVMVVLAMVHFMAEPSQAITCGQVDASLVACLPYLTTGGIPPKACCQGVQSLKNLTPTTVDRQTACNCIKEAASKYANIKDDAATALPTKCGVPINIPISRTTNCNNVS